MLMDKTYNRMLSYQTFEDRYEYLKLHGIVGRATFGFERYLNQTLYRSREWKLIRIDVITRDEGCDLGIPDREIYGRIFVHHINPITMEDIDSHSDKLFDLNNLICCSDETHNAIHYGNASLLPTLPEKREKGDTCLWMRASLIT